MATTPDARSVGAVDLPSHRIALRGVSRRDQQQRIKSCRLRQSHREPAARACLIAVLGIGPAVDDVGDGSVAKESAWRCTHRNRDGIGLAGPRNITGFPDEQIVDRMAISNRACSGLKNMVPCAAIGFQITTRTTWQLHITEQLRPSFAGIGAHRNRRPACCIYTQTELGGGSLPGHIARIRQQLAAGRCTQGSA